jgi:hypothetical protein
MSAPLFIRKVVTGYGADHHGLDIDLHTTTTDTLIERIRYHGTAYDSLAGEIVVWLTPPAAGIDYPARSVQLAANTYAVSGYLQGEIRLDLPLPTGWTIAVQHTLQQPGPFNFTMAFILDGGELG